MQSFSTCTCVMATRQVMGALISKALLALHDDRLKNSVPADDDNRVDGGDGDAAAAAALDGDDVIMRSMACYIRNFLLPHS